MFYIKDYISPLGKMLLVCNDKAIVGVYFQEQEKGSKAIGREDDFIEDVNHELLQSCQEWLERYFRGENPDVKKIPLQVQGTLFQEKVWKKLLQIPYGQTVSYGQIAKQMAQEEGKKSMSAQAVGGAVGKNPIAILIPCHRVIGANGNLTGYAGGLDRKKALLEIEKG